MENMLVCEQLKSTIESPQALPVSICASVTVRVDGICVGLQETDEEKVEYMFDTDRDLQTGVWTDNGTDSQTETETVYFTETDSQTETETDSQTETETDSQTETETDSQTETEADSQTETETNSQTEIETNSHTDEQTRTVTDESFFYHGTAEFPPVVMLQDRQKANNRKYMYC
jgi:hypothetical protein